MNAITIDEGNPKYTVFWRFNVVFDSGIVRCRRGHTNEAAYNFFIKYEPTCWGDENQIAFYFRDNFILPYLLAHNLVKQDSEGLIWPISPEQKFLDDHFEIIVVR